MRLSFWRTLRLCKKLHGVTSQWPRSERLGTVYPMCINWAVKFGPVSIGKNASFLSDTWEWLSTKPVEVYAPVHKCKLSPCIPCAPCTYITFLVWVSDLVTRWSPCLPVTLYTGYHVEQWRYSRLCCLRFATAQLEGITPMDKIKDWLWTMKEDVE
jgi:hypothetical protein